MSGIYESNLFHIPRNPILIKSNAGASSLIFYPPIPNPAPIITSNMNNTRIRTNPPA